MADVGNIGNPLLYTYAHVGTKRLIEDYIEQVCLTLNYLCDTELDFLTLEQKQRFFEDTFHSYGQPATFATGRLRLLGRPRPQPWRFSQRFRPGFR